MFKIHLKDTVLDLTTPLVMGILNATPDSFFKGSRMEAIDLGVQKAIEMVNFGASIIDIGGQSTRPGADLITTTIEIERVVPMIKAIHAALPQIPISIDTYHAVVAKAAINAGALLVNDISCGNFDSKMIPMVVANQVGYIGMHQTGGPGSMHEVEARTNIMETLRGGAGGSGIAGLAQAMANSSAKFARQSAASIGAQEAKNNMLAQQNQAKINMLTAQEDSKNNLDNILDEGKEAPAEVRMEDEGPSINDKIDRLLDEANQANNDAIETFQMMMEGQLTEEQNAKLEAAKANNDLLTKEAKNKNTEQESNTAEVSDAATDDKTIGENPEGSRQVKNFNYDKKKNGAIPFEPQSAATEEQDKNQLNRDTRRSLKNDPTGKVTIATKQVVEGSTAMGYLATEYEAQIIDTPKGKMFVRRTASKDKTKGLVPEVESPNFIQPGQEVTLRVVQEGSKGLRYVYDENGNAKNVEVACPEYRYFAWGWDSPGECISLPRFGFSGDTYIVEKR